MQVDPNSIPDIHPRVYDHLNELVDVFNGADIDYRGKNVVLGHSKASCGITVLSGISYTSPNKIVRKILVERAESDTKKIREAFVMWSDIDYNQGKVGGKSLAKYIRDNRLGPITEFGPVMNPNSGNMIMMWVWQPPHPSHKPKDKHMPVFGKIRKYCKDGCCVDYIPGEGEANSDRRFLDSREDNKLEKSAGINPA